MRSLLVAALLLATAVTLAVVALRGEPELEPGGAGAGEPVVAPGPAAPGGPATADAGAGKGRRSADPQVERIAAEGGLTGRVLWADGEPAAGASVWCTPRRRGPVQRSEADVDVEGRFVFAGLQSGDYRLRVLHPKATDTLSFPVEIPAGETFDLHDLWLVRGLPLGGKVVLVAGDERRPAKEGWSVRAFAAEGASKLARIGEGGTFRFEAMDPGIYEVVLWHRSWRTTPAVRASAGQHDVLLEAVRGEAVFTGSVTHPDGRSLQVFELEVMDEGTLRPYARTSRNWGQGHYRTTPLPPGRYRLRFLAGGRRPREVAAVLPETGEVRVDVVLPELRAVRGVVLGASGRPLPGARVEVLGAPPGHPAMDRMGLERIFEGLGGYQPGIFANTDSEGRFSLPPQESASLVLVRDMDHAMKLVAVPPDGDGDLLIRLDEGVAVSGRLEDEEGRGVAGVRVMLLAEGGLLDPRRQVEETDGGGRFAFAPVGRGTWSVLVIRDRGPHPRQPDGSPAFDRTFEVGTRDVDLGNLR